MGYDVVALGELLIDFTSSGLSGQGNPLFEANPGGAPCNVLAMLARLGKRTAFIGKVGEDMFGSMLADTISRAGIDASGLIMDGGSNTTLAFVRNGPDGERDFSFFRKPGADTRLQPEELDTELIQSGSIFHFGTLSLTHQPAKAATIEAVSCATDAEALISFDPNLRLPLWDNLADAGRSMEWGCSRCHILKIADDELAFLTGMDDMPCAVEALRRSYPNIRLILVTKGRHGSDAYYGEYHTHYPAFDVDTVDTTGAGDTFLGCALAYVLDNGLDTLDESRLTDMLRYANAAAALTTTKMGAIRSMPASEDIATLISKNTIA